MLKVFKNKAETTNLSTCAATLVISFYKNIRMLELVLASLEIQTFKNFNLIICDDGSPENTVTLLHQKLESLSISSLHLWHEDNGFRKNRILNWAIHYCQTPLMIFIDQDCILHSEFIKEHVENRIEKTVLCGRRINLTSFVSRFLNPEKIKTQFLEKNIWWLLSLGLFMKDNNGIKGLYFKNIYLRKWANKKYRSIVGCNFSIFKSDLIAVNGFDTRYEGAGFGEDSDLDFRLTLNQVKMLPACNTAVQYHIYHRLLTRSNENEDLFNKVVQQKKIETAYGLKQQILNLD